MFTSMSICLHPDFPLMPMAGIPPLASPQIVSPQAVSLRKEADGCRTISKCANKSDTLNFEGLP